MLHGTIRNDDFERTFLLPSQKITIFHSLTTLCDIDIADPSSMQEACQIWTLYIASLSMSSP